MVGLRLAKAGYGTPGEIVKMPTDEVLAMVAYEDFLIQYNDRFLELNKES